jgi:inosine triphosphate pyrophosphatase
MRNRLILGNKNKLREVQEILGSDRLTNQKLDLLEIQGTIEEIATHKAKTAAEILGKPVIVEDTALEFCGLGGLPGPYIKWFLEKLGNQGREQCILRMNTLRIVSNSRAI